MGNHTIGNRRGSVRGAPPDVYVGFASIDDDGESMGEAVALFVKFFLIAGMWIFLYFILAVLWGVGILPDEIAE